MKFYKYIRMCWAGYSTGLNEGMFRKEERKFGNEYSMLSK